MWVVLKKTVGVSKGLLKYYASSSNQNTTLAKLTVSNSL